MNPIDFRHIAAPNMRAVKELFLIECMVFWDTRPMLISQILMPILYFVFIVAALSSTVGEVAFAGRRMPYLEYAMVGLLAMEMMTQMYRAVYRMVVGRQHGFFAMEMQSGVKPFWYILVMSTSSVMGYILQSAVFWVLILLFQMDISFSHFLAMWLTGLVGMYFWIGMATFIAMAVNSFNTRDMVMSFIITPLSFSAPSFYVLTDAPRFVQILAVVNPLTYQLHAIREAAFGLFNGYSFALILAVSLVSLAAASFVVGRAKLMTSERT